MITTPDFRPMSPNKAAETFNIAPARRYKIVVTKLDVDERKR